MRARFSLGWLAYRRRAAGLLRTPGSVRALVLGILLAAAPAHASEPQQQRIPTELLQAAEAKLRDVRPVERIHFFRDQLRAGVPADAPAFRQIWSDCAPKRTREDLLSTPRAIRASDPAEAVEVAGCAALAELRCAAATRGGLRQEAIPGFHLVRLPRGFRLASAGHVITFAHIRAQRRGASLALERDCTVHVGDGVALDGVRLSTPRFADPGVTAASLDRGDADYWSSEPHDGADLGYFDLTFDATPAGAASRALVAAIALRTYQGVTEDLGRFNIWPVCSFGTGFMGGFDNRVRIKGCVAEGALEMQASRLEEGRCRFRAPTTAYFSGAPLIGFDEAGPVAICVISSEPGSEPSSPIAGGVPVVERDHARRYTPALANNGVLYPR
ncbi:MAG: hypothetical protein JNJ73_20420 [Hyphomonadaceae bacterium]|nr:hypothetical protein [Hyphomonadaceae bacterium]